GRTGVVGLEGSLVGSWRALEVVRDVRLDDHETPRRRRGELEGLLHRVALAGAEPARVEDRAEQDLAGSGGAERGGIGEVDPVHPGHVARAVGPLVPDRPADGERLAAAAGG